MQASPAQWRQAGGRRSHQVNAERGGQVVRIGARRRVQREVARLFYAQSIAFTQGARYAQAGEPHYMRVACCALSRRYAVMQARSRRHLARQPILWRGVSRRVLRAAKNHKSRQPAERYRRGRQAREGREQARHRYISRYGQRHSRGLFIEVTRVVRRRSHMRDGEYMVLPRRISPAQEESATERAIRVEKRQQRGII